jgi:autotransporter family porin
MDRFMTHRLSVHAPLGKRLLTTTSALAIAAGISTAAHAQQITNPNPIPNPTVGANTAVTAIVFDDGQSHTGSIVNNGTVKSVSVGVLVTANGAGNGTTINGGITNAQNATITGQTTAILVGDRSTVTGAIVNNGTIVGGNRGFGISVAGGSRVAGGIANASTGKIMSGFSGIQISGATIGSSASANVMNAGAISSGLNAIGISASTVNGAVTNSGKLFSALSAGILVSSSAVDSIANSAGGAINGSDGIAVDGISTPAGVVLRSTVSGSITNGGTISAKVSGIKVTQSTVGSAATPGRSTWMPG